MPSMNSISQHLRKILMLSMESSFRKKEINEIISRILEKIEKLHFESADEIEKIKKEFNDVLKEFKVAEKDNLFFEK